MFRASLIVATAALALACPSLARERPEPRRYADPGAIVAAEIAFARLAQDKGQWTAFAKTATKDALMFVPTRTNAQKWLKGRRNPAQAVRWQAHDIWMSCDGTLAISTGAAQWPGGGDGEFLTIWQRQSKGGYKWVADMGRSVKTPLAPPEMVRTHVAACQPAVPEARRVATSEDGNAITGQSRDGTLQYSIVEANGGPVVHLVSWEGAAFSAPVVKPFADD